MHPVILLITSINHKVHAGGPGFIFDKLNEIKNDTAVICAFTPDDLCSYDTAAVIYQDPATCDVELHAEQQVMQLTPWKRG